MKMRTAFFTVLVAVLVAASAPATTLVRMSLDQLTQASTEIIRGHVVSQQTLWNPAHNRIYTYTSFALDQTYKGNPPSTLVVQQPGGTVDKVRVFVAGTIQFHAQASYMLFLERSPADSSKFLPVGMMQGAYRIYNDAVTREEMLILPLGSLLRGVMAASAGRPALQESRQRTTLAGPSVPVPEFRRELSAALSTPLIIPRGTAIPLTVRSAQSGGSRLLDILGRTDTDLFPNAGLVIPAGSTFAGKAERVGNLWSISWTQGSIRGRQILLSARSTAPAAQPLHGRLVVLNVR